MGAVLCVVLAEFFMNSNPVLKVDTFAHPEVDVGIFTSAMTYKFVGAIRGMGHLESFQIKALVIGLAIGLVIALARRALAASAGYQRLIKSGTRGFAIGWLVDAVLLSSPYASSTGGFLNLEVALWFATGGVASSLLASFAAARKRRGAGAEELPADMSTTSLVGGGLIAGESLYALGAGMANLLSRYIK
jgi:tetrahydromethanopterin S-methyltransferase subunit F